MRDPVFSRIFSQREVPDCPYADVAVQMKKKSETGLRKNSVCESRMDVLPRDISGWGCEAIRHQELLYGEVRKLHHPHRRVEAVVVLADVLGDGDQTRARR